MEFLFNFLLHHSNYCTKQHKNTISQYGDFIWFVIKRPVQWFSYVFMSLRCCFTFWVGWGGVRWDKREALRRASIYIYIYIFCCMNHFQFFESLLAMLDMLGFNWYSEISSNLFNLKITINTNVLWWRTKVLHGL